MPLVYHSLICFGAGFAGGISSSSPLGPINLIVAQWSFTNKTWRIIPFLLGVILIDTIFALLAALGITFLEIPPTLKNILSLLGGGILIGLGIIFLKEIKKKTTNNSTEPAQRPISFIHDFLMGALLCASNPGFLLFWLFAISSLHTYLGTSLTGFNIFLFIAGVVVGDGAWFWLLHRMAVKSLAWISEQIYARIRYVLGSAMIGCGIFAIIHTTLSLP